MEVNRYCSGLLFMMMLTWLWISLPMSLDAQSLTSQKASDLVLPDKNGQKIQLSDTQGKYVLLHFWASWCPNSGVAIPNMKTLYQKYHKETFKTATGFEIFSVSLDSDNKAWKEAMNKHQMTWLNCLDERGFDSPLAHSYGVWYTPASFLLDPTGKIVLQNPSLSQVDALLAQEQVADNISYKVEIGTFPTLKFHNFAPVKELGAMDIEKQTSGDKIVLIGSFETKKTAEYIMEQVVEHGYENARLVAYNHEERLAHLPDEKDILTAGVSDTYVKFTEEIKFTPAVKVPATSPQPTPAKSANTIQFSEVASPTSKPAQDVQFTEVVSSPTPPAIVQDKASTKQPTGNFGYAPSVSKNTPAKEQLSRATKNYPFSPATPQNLVAKNVKHEVAVASKPTNTTRKTATPKKEDKHVKKLGFDVSATKPTAINASINKPIPTSLSLTQPKADIIAITTKKRAKKEATTPSFAKTTPSDDLLKRPFDSYPSTYNAKAKKSKESKKAKATKTKSNYPSDYRAAIARSKEKQGLDKNSSKEKTAKATKKAARQPQTAKAPAKTKATKEDGFKPWPKSTPTWDMAYDNQRKLYQENNWNTEEQFAYEEVEVRGKKALKLKKKQDKLKRKRAKLKKKVKNIQEEEMTLKEEIMIRSIYE